MVEIFSNPVFQYSALGLTLAILIIFWRYILMKENQSAEQINKSEKRQDETLRQLIALTTSSVAANVEAAGASRQAAQVMMQISANLANHDATTSKAHESVSMGQREILHKIDKAANFRTRFSDGGE